MALTFPKSTIVGLDALELYKVQVKHPANCIYKKHNVDNGIPYPDKTFDYVHCSNALFVQADYNSVPIGWGPKPVGEYLQKNMFMLVNSLKPRLMASNGATEAEFDDLLEKCYKEWPE
ncbi:hypothetical protein BC937DRAFT_91632, partial [Endogone sp. FLAS-F59071]